MRSTRADRTIDDKEHTVNLARERRRGAAVHTTGKLEIRGLDCSVNRRSARCGLEHEGKPFDAWLSRRVSKQVKDQGIFDNLGETEFADQSQRKVAKTVDVTLFSSDRSLPSPAGENWVPHP